MSAISYNYTQPVAAQVFADCGFNPRFSLQGTYFDPNHFPVTVPAPASSGWSWFASANQQLINAVSACQILEARLAQYEYAGFATIDPSLSTLDEDFPVGLTSSSPPVHHFHMTAAQKTFFAVEHLFFQKVGELAKIAFPERKFALFPFSSELLRPIHAISKPQTDDFSKEDVANMDLTRLNGLGFHAFASLERQKKFELEIAEARAALKYHIREFRDELSQISQEALSNPSDFPARFALCKASLAEVVAAWKIYTVSSDILFHLQSLYEKQDYFAPYYDEQYQYRYTPVRLALAQEDGAVENLNEIVELSIEQEEVLEKIRSQQATKIKEDLEELTK